MSWSERFAELSALDASDRDLLERNAQLIELPEGVRVFAPGKRPEAFLLLLEGTVVVRQLGANGREIVLYRVNGGESCIMTTACLLSDEDYLAEGVTATEVRAVALGREAFDALIARSSAFRRLVFSKYASRLTRLMEVVEGVAFERLDRRLARKLIELAGGGDEVDATHQMLATELGSAREVISRQMKTFATQGWVESARGRVRICNAAALRSLAQSH